ncbi:MAG: SRPBCC family protein [Armatimonadetes bacterium]|nr:SRPBCC family protein [Armatimonadota bacterium]
MPTVDTSVLVHAPLDKVYAIARDNRSFPDFMDDVKSLTVVEDDGVRVVSDWVGVVSAFNIKVRWTQEDVWDNTAHTCTFKQLKGDYDMMEGVWKFTDMGQNITRFESHLEYEYVVPGLGAIVKKVLHGLVIKNMDAVLNAIKKRAEG